MNLNNKPFVKLLKTAFLGKKSNISIKEPTWEQVKNVLMSFDKEANEGFIELSDINDMVTMVIYGQKNVYHIGIVKGEDEFYYYWNGSEPTETSIPVAGNFFKAHQICSDYITLKEIVHYFYETGKQFEEVQWESEHL